MLFLFVCFVFLYVCFMYGVFVTGKYNSAPEAYSGLSCSVHCPLFEFSVCPGPRYSRGKFWFLLGFMGLAGSIFLQLEPPESHCRSDPERRGSRQQSLLLTSMALWKRPLENELFYLAACTRQAQMPGPVVEEKNGSCY